jgi:hypothetical protein
MGVYRLIMALAKRVAQVAVVAAVLTLTLFGAGAAHARVAGAEGAAASSGFQLSSRTLVGYGAWTDPEGALGIAEADAFRQADLFGLAFCDVVDRQVFPLGTGGGAWEAFVTISCLA